MEVLDLRRPRLTANPASFKTGIAPPDKAGEAPFPNLLEAAQSQKEVSINQALDKVDDFVEPVDLAIVAGANVVSASNAVHGFLNLTGALGAGATVELPDTLSKLTVLINSTTGGQTVQAKVGSGGTLRTIAAGEAILIWETGWQMLGTGSAAGGPPTGAAGGGLAGTYPNPTINPEAIDDRVAALVVDGTGINAVYDDGANTLTINAIGRTIGATFDGGGTDIPAGTKARVRVPFACTIVKVTVLAEAAGSMVLDIWKDTYANYPPTIGETITAAAKPTLSTANKYEDATLTGWTTAIAAGDTIVFNVDSCSGITQAIIILEVA